MKNPGASTGDGRTRPQIPRNSTGSSAALRMIREQELEPNRNRSALHRYHNDICAVGTRKCSALSPRAPMSSASLRNSKPARRDATS